MPRNGGGVLSCLFSFLFVSAVSICMCVKLKARVRVEAEACGVNGGPKRGGDGREEAKGVEGRGGTRRTGSSFRRSSCFDCLPSATPPSEYIHPPSIHQQPVNCPWASLGLVGHRWGWTSIALPGASPRPDRTGKRRLHDHLQSLASTVSSCILIVDARRRRWRRRCWRW